jgi:SulP family sulfate permease
MVLVYQYTAIHFNIKTMLPKIKISIPLINTIKNYQKPWLRKDLIAGVTVAAVAVPQAMAYSQLAGVPLITGLYTALISMLIFAIFTTSRLAIVGPDAAMAALTGAALLPLATTDPAEYLSLVSLLAILIGAACLVALYARLGFIAEFISRPILLGYMAGLALAVIVSQAPKLFGLSLPSASSVYSTGWYVASNVSNFSWPTILLSCILIAAAILLQRYVKKIPMSLIILVGSILASYFFSFSSHDIAIVGTVPTGLPIPRLPSFSLDNLQNLVVPALMISLVSYANTIATTRSFASHQKGSIETTQEFFGLGVSNIGSGLFGGMPVAASGARTAVNFSSKAVTQVSQLFGALAIGIVLLFLAQTLSYLPLAALAVIVIMAVKSLFNYRELRSIRHAWRSEAVLAVITLLGVTILGIFQGLLLAVLLAFMNLVRKNTTPKYAILGIAENGAIRDMNRPPKTKGIPGLIIFRFDAPLNFVNSIFFRDAVYRLIDEAKSPVSWFLWDAETITALDSTSGQMLLELIKDIESKNIVFAVSRLKGPMRETIRNSHRLFDALEAAPHFSRLGDAIDAFHESEK